MLLRVEDLRVRFHSDDGIVRAVDGLSYEIARGETLGIVGESGSGKSVGCLALMGLIPTPPGEIAAGRALFDGRDLLTLSRREQSAIRGRRIAMIFQDPLTALNPFLTVEEQLTEATMYHLGHGYREALKHAVGMLERVGIPGASRRIRDYPHQFSGGMRQRVMIAMALSCGPELVIADEPTTALDVTIQAQIMDLLRELQRDNGMAMILITHDLGLVAGNCDRVNVMYAGRFVEEAPVDELFARPKHPYTRGLMSSLPRVDRPGAALTPIPGQPPDLARLPAGCPFAPRCEHATERCQSEFPATTHLGTHRRYACYHPYESPAVASESV
ncbi:MAG: ABC transporter ATP-binding protein [Pirellulales bacterium]